SQWHVHHVRLSSSLESCRRVCVAVSRLVLLVVRPSSDAVLSLVISCQLASVFCLFFHFFFFFQAEDGIRDKLVTGVQTCALPISISPRGRSSSPSKAARSRKPSRMILRKIAQGLLTSLYPFIDFCSLAPRNRAAPLDRKSVV